jgi:hypothetical protein
MALNKVKRERITDSLLKLQSASSALRGVDPGDVPDLEDVQDCLKDADKILGAALRSPAARQPRKGQH